MAYGLNEFILTRGTILRSMSRECIYTLQKIVILPGFTTDLKLTRSSNLTNVLYMLRNTLNIVPPVRVGLHASSLKRKRTLQIVAERPGL